MSLKSCVIIANLAIFYLHFAATAATNGADCIGCHQQAVSDWQQSDHAKAMDVANDKSVLGDFSNVTVSHFSQTAHFYKQDNQFLIRFTEGDKTTEYSVAYTFGHYPLQEYLIAAKGGRYQVFPFAWDSRPIEQGGQKWYPIYADEDIQANDRLHWQQPLQNWNGMCADCHSDGLRRQYRAKTDSFDTHWDNINVGCQSCHGDMVEHQTSPQIQSNSHSTLILNNHERQEMGHWLLDKDAKVAKWSGNARENDFMDNCYACHALRSPLTDGFKPNTPFLDQFSPSLLQSPLYHADGQIKDEVYVYGSFQQSKMFQAGVSCVDCHNPHSMKLKVQGNGLCLQCHNAQEYQQPAHLQHPVDSEAAQCVSCHMPTQRYMGVDDRRDHSFRIPRPELSVQYQVPNSCNACHQQQSADWAVEKITQLYGNHNPLSVNQQAFIRLQHQFSLPIEQHLAVINDASLNAIYRASAIALLPNSITELSDADIKAWVTADEPLIRLATAQIGYLLPLVERTKSYLQILNDEYKAVRATAANHLLHLGLDYSESLQQAFKELTLSNQVNQWRGEGGLNIGMLQLALQQLQPAISALEQAIAVDPYFTAAYINLADIYRMVELPDKEKATFEQGIHANPKSALLQYSFGMHLIRHGHKDEALTAFAQAVKFEATNVQFAYVYFIALDNVGKTQQALSQLKMVIKKYHYNPQLLQLGLSYSQKVGDQATFQTFRMLLSQEASRY